MSTLRIRLANFFAAQSLRGRQPCRFVRIICRLIYRFIMEFRANDEYPYADMRFADWPETDEEISDWWNFIVRRSTSYMAWLIKAECGIRLKLPTPGKRESGENPFDARHWDEILEYKPNGWQRIPKEGWMTVERPDRNESPHFIGIIADEGEYGQLVWLVDAQPRSEHDETPCWHVWTYEKFRKTERFIPMSEDADVVWYREPKKVA